MWQSVFDEWTVVMIYDDLPLNPVNLVSDSVEACERERAPF